MVTNEETKETVAIDPGGSLRKIDTYILEEELLIQGILLTHGHFDHIMGIDALRKYNKAPVYISEEDYPLLSDAKGNASKTFVHHGFTYSGGTPMKDGDIIKAAGYKFNLIKTPGHTPGSCCYYVESEGVLFSGDTLFRASIGRTDLEGGSEDIYESIKERLFVLPQDTIVYPGHGMTTTIGYEKENNPFFRK